MTRSEMNELEFLAFRYVANEMTEGERFSFETRLADDLTACEAVAAVVELTQALALNRGELESVETTESRELVPASCGRVDEQSDWQRSSWLRPAVWMSMGAAACLVAVLFSQGIRTPLKSPVAVQEKPSIARQRQAEARAEKLALVWSQMRHVEAAEDTDDDAHDDSADESITDEDSHATEPSKIVAHDTVSPKSLRTPSWIAAAVSGLAKASPPATNADDDVEEL